MDITNAMLSFKIAPAMDLQKLLEEESRWVYVAKMWAEDAAAEKLVFIDPVTKKLVPAAEELIKELFTRSQRSTQRRGARRLVTQCHRALL